MRKWIAGVAVLVVAAGAAAFLWLGDGTADVRPAVFRAESSTAHYAPIATRALDPEPLTAAEMFPGASVTAGEVTLERKDTESLDDCAEAVWGAAADALAGCTQVLRARYATADGKVTGQFLIFNLADSAAADRLVAAFKGDGFVRPAPGTPEGFDAPRSWAQARALGHYVTVSWVGPAVSGTKADLTYPQVAVDGVGLVIQRRLLR
ncbi:hypothetical protein FHS43_004216 [Streptosporangium becharense]|uniref:Uncharacterized protein n=1 Tax=Streptosporangium becharense TaxID=1816182 RepID=A0A7W9ICM5_9ACTN|nr:hypothetical protein [Streptosporangium becharense]MBB2912921.1 hypothetical protein [Streptosporangium becharense]MBB5818254.1 hypothetical protein [Streptosporangium becharense]